MHKHTPIPLVQWPIFQGRWALSKQITLSVGDAVIPLGSVLSWMLSETSVGFFSLLFLEMIRGGPPVLAGGMVKSTKRRD